MIAEFEVTAPVTLVVPVPLTALPNVPPVRVKLLLFVTVPLIFVALELIVPALVIAPVSEPNAALLVKVAPLFTVTVWFIPPAFVVVPEIVVLPVPFTAFAKVPPFKFKVFVFDTAPLIFEALEFIIPALVIAPLSEPNVELLVKVTPLFTVTA